MEQERRTIVYDAALEVEAYRLTGLVRPFPPHFHPHYVIGFLEDGVRQLTYGTQVYVVSRGDLTLFEPEATHACVQLAGTLDYRAFNISREAMLRWTQEATGAAALPRFPSPVVRDEELAGRLRALHAMVMGERSALETEEALLLSLARLMERHSRHDGGVGNGAPAGQAEVARACALIEARFTEPLSLEEISQSAGVSKSTLLRAFTRARGITPYRYLQTLRVNEAKRLLEQGLTPVEAALKAGFSDQSHLTNFFCRFIGLTPGAYREMVLQREEQAEGGGPAHEA